MCPQCTGTDIEDEMAKITLSGPSNAAAELESEVKPEGSLETKVTRAKKEEESSQPVDGGGSSKQSSSSETPDSGETISESKPAQTTENPSKKGQTGRGSARSTATGRKADK
jgi:hypothetical protein